MQGMTRAGMAISILGLAMGMSLPARSATQIAYAYSNPGGACQLSVPTIDTKVRPKASGFRNEGTTNNFVICGYSKVSLPVVDLISVVIGLVSMDGAVHDVSCTAVSGLAGSSDLLYSTALVTVPASGGLKTKAWYPADFGSANPRIPNSYAPSVTCNLPPQVSITYLAANFDQEIGA